MAVHELKTWPEYYQEVLSGNKKAELRKDDRPFMVGDLLVLKEYDPKSTLYTGRNIIVKITHILHGGQFVLEEGYVMMSFKIHS